MRILLDTQLYLWYIGQTPQMTVRRRAAIEHAHEIYVSAASIWEAIIKIGLGRLTVDPHELVASISRSGFLELPVTAEHTLALHTLPPLHRDPFDRILIAQSIAEPLQLFTADAVVGSYSDRIRVI